MRAHAPEIVLLHLTGERELITERQAERKGHFMPRSLIDSQFATPGPDEQVVTVDVAPDEEPVVATAVDLLRAPGQPPERPPRWSPGAGVGRGVGTSSAAVGTEHVRAGLVRAP